MGTILVGTMGTTLVGTMGTILVGTMGAILVETPEVIKVVIQEGKPIRSFPTPQGQTPTASRSTLPLKPLLTSPRQLDPGRP